MGEEYEPSLLDILGQIQQELEDAYVAVEEYADYEDRGTIVELLDEAATNIESAKQLARDQ